MYGSAASELAANTKLVLRQLDLFRRNILGRLRRPRHVDRLHQPDHARESKTRLRTVHAGLLTRRAASTSRYFTKRAPQRIFPQRRKLMNSSN
jgi:hypothetical protein